MDKLSLDQRLEVLKLTVELAKGRASDTKVLLGVVREISATLTEILTSPAPPES